MVRADLVAVWVSLTGTATTHDTATAVKSSVSFMAAMKVWWKFGGGLLETCWKCVGSLVGVRCGGCWKGEASCVALYTAATGRRTVSSISRTLVGIIDTRVSASPTLANSPCNR